MPASINVGCKCTQAISGAMAMVERSVERKIQIFRAGLDVTIQDYVVRMLKRALDVESEDDREARSEPMERER
jgi:hypothetical protein